MEGALGWPTSLLERVSQGEGWVGCLHLEDRVWHLGSKYPKESEGLRRGPLHVGQDGEQRRSTRNVRQQCSRIKEQLLPTPHKNLDEFHHCYVTQRKPDMRDQCCMIRFGQNSRNFRARAQERGLCTHGGWCRHVACLQKHDRHQEG